MNSLRQIRQRDDGLFVVTYRGRDYTHPNLSLAFERARQVHPDMRTLSVWVVALHAYAVNVWPHETRSLGVPPLCTAKPAPYEKAQDPAQLTLAA